MRPANGPKYIKGTIEYTRAYREYVDMVHGRVRCEYSSEYE